MWYKVYGYYIYYVASIGEFINILWYGKNSNNK